MPIEWVLKESKAPENSGAFCFADGGPPMVQLHLWPHRSLPNRGFVAFFAISFALVSLPLLAVLGTAALWGLLPFVAATFGAMWWLLRKSYRDGEILENLCLWRDHMTLERHDPDGSRKNWQANPYWVRLKLRREGPPVENYITLTGGPREVELGAFLSPEERMELYTSLTRYLGETA